MPDAAWPSACADAIVGGGWAGIYFAYRRALAAPQDAPSMCIFEASQRIGGRTYSVPAKLLGHEGFTLDVGAYRFSPDMHLPGDLILHDLQLPTACYEPNCPDAKADFPKPFHFNYSAPLRRIVNPKTLLPSGYDTAMRVMLAKMEAVGVRVFLEAPLLEIQRDEARQLTQLHFHRGTIRASGAVMLNLPRNKLMALASVSSLVPPRTLQMLKCVKFDSPRSLFNHSLSASTALAKAYLFYEDAWWHTRIHQTTGQYPANAFEPVLTPLGIRFGIHWNDGPVTCINSTSGARLHASAARRAGTGVECKGYLEVYYAATNETFWYSATGAPDDPLGIVRTAPPYDHQKLELAHTALLEAIAPVLAHAGVSPQQIPQPTSLVVGAWSRPGVIKNDTGYTAPTKVYWHPTMSGSPAGACGVDGLTDDEYRTSVLQPLGKHVPVYLANNDWVCQDVTYMYGDWAEESLLQAERALWRLGVPKPPWLNGTYYAANVVRLA